MKKTILSILFLTIFSLTTKAQSNTTFGVKSGVNFANINSEFNLNPSSKAAIYFGGFAEYALKKRFSIQSEILYSRQQVVAFEAVLGGPSLRVEYTLDYIQIPILAKFYLNKNTSLEIGPSYNILLNDQSINLSNNAKRNNFAKKSDFNIALGANYKFNNGLFTTVRYYKGLSNIIYNNKMNAFQIGVGYIFSKK
jgi:predicted porin